MGLIDFILNLAGVLLWLNWRSSRLDPLAKRLPATLMGTLRPATARMPHRWEWVAIVLGLLAGRAWVYWEFGSSMSPVWTGKINFGTVILAFSCRGGWPGLERMLVFSFLSFAWMLGIVYLCMTLLSLLQGPEPFQRVVRASLGRVDGWPGWAKILAPWLALLFGWLALTWLLAGLHIIPPPISPAQRVEQAVVIATGAFLVWKFALAALLFLYLLNSYVYLGNNPFWKYVYLTGRTVLSPLAPLPLRLGKVDFAPVLAVALVFLVAEGLGQALIWLYPHLPI